MYFLSKEVTKIISHLVGFGRANITWFYGHNNNNNNNLFRTNSTLYGAQEKAVINANKHQYILSFLPQKVFNT